MIYLLSGAKAVTAGKNSSAKSPVFGFWVARFRRCTASNRKMLCVFRSGLRVSLFVYPFGMTPPGAVLMHLP